MSAETQTEARAADEWLLADYAKTVGNLRADLTRAQLQGSLMLEALKQAANRFRFYEAEHAKKGTFEGDAKAQTNADMAVVCEAAIASVRPLTSGEAR